MVTLAQEPKFTLQELEQGIAGYKIPISTAYKMIRLGELGSYIVRGRRLVGLHHLQELFEAGEMPKRQPRRKGTAA